MHFSCPIIFEPYVLLVTLVCLHGAEKRDRVLLEYLNFQNYIKSIDINGSPDTEILSLLLFILIVPFKKCFLLEVCLVRKKGY